MKKILLFALVLISCAVFAGDLVPNSRPCPEGGYRSKDGLLCCKNGFAYMAGHYASIQTKQCGCPDGGTPHRNACCKDGYAFDEILKGGSGKYDMIDPGLCCPLGGERVSTGECCKDNYEYNGRTKKYDLINGHCGCPNGAVPAPREWAGSLHCCKDGFALGSSGHSPKSNFKSVWVELCGCPQNGIPVIWESEHVNECCTPDRLYRLVLDAYDDYRPDLCKHPDAQRLMKKYFDKRPIQKSLMKMLGV